MKKLLVLAMVAVLVFSFAFTAVSKGGPPDRCDGHECYIDSGCEDGVCWYLKCCRDEYFYKGQCVWGDYVCVSLI